MILNPYRFASAGAGAGPWNPLDKNADIVLSDVNSVATTTPGGVTQQGVRSLQSVPNGGVTAGKYYFEASFGNQSGSTDTCRVGVANSSQSLSAALGDGTNGSAVSSHGLRYTNGDFGSIMAGTVPANGRLQVFLFASGSGTRLYFGVDDAIKFGATRADIEAGNATGDLSISSATYFAAASSARAPIGGNAGVITLHITAADCLYLPPTGFTYWPS